MNEIKELDYEEKRARMLEECRNEPGIDIQLHNEVVAELLMYMDGGHPAFGNIVSEICMEVEETRKTVFSVTIEKMRHCPEYRKADCVAIMV
jgi:hypothetical protein